MKNFAAKDRRMGMWTIVIVLFLTYLINGIWYANSFWPHVSPPRPLPNSTWWRLLPYNTTFFNNPEDFSTLVDISDFHFLINNKACDGAGDLLLVIFVHSAPKNFRKRKAIRETWGHEGNLVDDVMRLIFLIGKVVDPKVQEHVANESDVHKDIVQGNFLDSYRNLTYKHVMGLKWVTYFCRRARYIFKADDDIFVDVFQLATYLKGYYGTSPPRNLMICYVIRSPFVKRSQRSKWRVSFKEYPQRYYPPYCSGWGIIMSPDVVFNLYLQSSQVPFFWVDDVHVSGTLAKRVGISHVDFTDKLALTKADVVKWMTSTEIVRPHLFGHPNSDVQTIYSLWNKTLQYYRRSSSHR